MSAVTESMTSCADGTDAATAVPPELGTGTAGVAWLAGGTEDGLVAEPGTGFAAGVVAPATGATAVVVTVELADATGRFGVASPPPLCSTTAVTPEMARTAPPTPISTFFSPIGKRSSTSPCMSDANEARFGSSTVPLTPCIAFGGV